MNAYTIPDAAKALGVTPRELRQWIEEGRLSAREAGGRRFVPRSEVMRMARRQPDIRGVESRGRVPHLEALQSDLDELRRRVEALERGGGKPPPRGAMRPALTPLFRPPHESD
jgi:excisionase family DNA binding protein